jgi:hypothetical protein
MLNIDGCKLCMIKSRPAQAFGEFAKSSSNALNYIETRIVPNDAGFVVLHCAQIPKRHTTIGIKHCA